MINITGTWHESAGAAHQLVRAGCADNGIDYEAHGKSDYKY